MLVPVSMLYAAYAALPIPTEEPLMMIGSCLNLSSWLAQELRLGQFGPQKLSWMLLLKHTVDMHALVCRAGVQSQALCSSCLVAGTA